MFAIGLLIYVLGWFFLNSSPEDEEGYVTVPSYVPALFIFGGGLMLGSVLQLAWKYLP